jgi:nitroimidazol reductase NimA-like FMN-containing flavoprotein (pyridoxamine 5'-phosphate oxidase superfamily)
MPTARPRTAIRRHPERALAVPDEAADILSKALVAHVGIAPQGEPVVIPFTFLYRDGSIYLHGSTASRMMKTLAGGAAACIEVTLVDALIASKSAETHSVNYRSVVCFGHGRLVDDEARRRAILTELIGRYFPGRTAGEHYRHIEAHEMKPTLVVEVPVEEMSAKGRSGGPLGPFDADPDEPGDARIVPVGPEGVG